MSAARNERGRFAKGNPGGPGGPTKAERQARDLELMSQLVAERTPRLVARAFERAEHSDEVLGGLLSFLALALGQGGIDHLRGELAMRQAARMAKH